MKELSRLLGSVPGSATMAVSEKARQMKAAGKDVIGLGGGDPDFATPDHIVAAAFAAIEDGATHYPPAKGFPEALTAVAAKMERENGVEVDPLEPDHHHAGRQVGHSPGSQRGNQPRRRNPLS